MAKTKISTETPPEERLLVIASAAEVAKGMVQAAVNGLLYQSTPNHAGNETAIMGSRARFKAIQAVAHFHADNLNKDRKNLLKTLEVNDLYK